MQIDTVERRIRRVVSPTSPRLLAINGCGPLTAAKKILGEAANVDRFRSEAHFARYAGVAPIPEWSGESQGRMRRATSGNRQLNRALHTIAMSQIRKGGLGGEDYYRRRVAEGNRHAQAIRCVKRRISRHVYNCLIAPMLSSETDAKVWRGGRTASNPSQ